MKNNLPDLNVTHVIVTCREEHSVHTKDAVILGKMSNTERSKVKNKQTNIQTKKQVFVPLFDCAVHLLIVRDVKVTSFTN